MMRDRYTKFNSSKDDTCASNQQTGNHVSVQLAMHSLHMIAGIDMLFGTIASMA